MTKRGLASSLAVGVLLFTRASASQAQTVVPVAPGSPAWLGDRRYNEGIGIRTGDVELHPGIAGEVGYDSNVFLRSSQSGVVNGAAPGAGVQPAPVIPSAVVRVTPSLYLSTISPQRREGDSSAQLPGVAFRAGVNATYRALFGLSSDASTTSNNPSQYDTVSGAADANLDILPGRPVAASVLGAVTRTILPNTATADPNVSFTQDSVRAGASLVFQPGGGTLDWRFGYEFNDTIFEQSVGAPYDNYSHMAYTLGRWRFRPRTALVYDGSIRFNSYADAQRAFDAGALLNSQPVRARIGLNGLIGDSFSATAMIGWGASFIDTAPLPQQQQYDSVIGQAELKWYVAPNPGTASPSDVSLALSSIAIGYTRDFQTSYLGNYYGIDRGYLNFNFFFAGRALVTLSGGVAAIEYPTIWWADQTFRDPSFTDVRADGTLFGEYRLADTFGLNATLRYTQNFSNTRISESEGVAGNFYGMAWQRFEAYLGARWFM